MLNIEHPPFSYKTQTLSTPHLHYVLIHRQSPPAPPLPSSFLSTQDTMGKVGEEHLTDS